MSQSERSGDLPRRLGCRVDGMGSISHFMALGLETNKVRAFYNWQTNPSTIPALRKDYGITE